VGGGKKRQVDAIFSAKEKGEGRAPARAVPRRPRKREELTRPPVSVEKRRTPEGRPQEERRGRGLFIFPESPGRKTRLLLAPWGASRGGKDEVGFYGQNVFWSRSTRTG